MVTLIDGDDLKERLERASLTLKNLGEVSVTDKKRLAAKREGVELALSYLDEALRQRKNDRLGTTLYDMGRLGTKSGQ